MKRRYRGVCRGCGAPTAPRNGKGDAFAYCKRCHPGAIAPQWTRERVREAMRAWQARYGAAPSSYDWSRTHARRRGGEALKTTRRRMARAVHRHRSVRQLGGGPRGRLRRRLNARATMPLLHGPSLCAWSSANAGADGRRTRHGHSSLQQQRGRRRSVTAGQGSDSDVRLQAAADRAAGKHLDDSRNRGKAGPATEPDGRARRHAHL